MRDRFGGADLANPRSGSGRTALASRGRRRTVYLIMGSWSGKLGPVRAAAARQCECRHGAGRHERQWASRQGRQAGRSYDIFSGAAMAYAEADLGIVQTVCWPLSGGSGMAIRPTDKLNGFSPAAWQDVTQITGDLVVCPPRYQYELCQAGPYVSSAVAGRADRRRPPPQVLWRLARRCWEEMGV